MTFRSNIQKTITQIFIPTYLTFGADVKSIQFTPQTVVKEFKNVLAFHQTVKFYDYIKPNEAHLFPVLWSIKPEPRVLTMSNCGSLVNLFNLPTNWEDQINALRSFFLRTGILILDIRFMPWTPYVLNNVCVQSDRMTLVDLALYSKKTETYIQTYFDKLIWQIKTYLLLRDYPVILYLLHIFLYLLWVLTDLVEKIQVSIKELVSRW